MKGPEFDEALFFRAIQDGGLRALLIGRRALIALGDAEDVRLLEELRRQREGS